MATSSPKWPSLYSLTVEFRPRSPAVNPDGVYFTQSGDVFVFIFYWMLIFYAPLFACSGALAVFNIISPPKRHRSFDPELDYTHTREHTRQSKASSSLAMLPLTPHRSPDPLLGPAHSQQHQPISPARAGGLLFPLRNARRTRATYALIVLLLFLLGIVASALLESLVFGYIIVGVYAAGGFHISTWVPFVWALLLAASSALGIFPSVLDRI